MNGDQQEKISVLLMVRELGIGGSERQTVETALFLRRERFSPHVGCFRPDGLRRRDLDAAGIPVLHLPVYSFKSAAAAMAARKLTRYLRSNNIQIVHTFDAPLNIFAVPVARLAGTPAVISSQRAHRDLVSPLNRLLLRATDRLADAIVVNCREMRRHLLADEHVNENKIHLCYNAVNTERYRRRSESRSGQQGVVIGTVCALRPEKGLDTLIGAFASIKHLGAKLLIVGSGPEEGALRNLCIQLGVETACRFQPQTTDVVEWLSQMDIFVLPSRSEALSNALMEAMACGCCPVATRVGGNPELVDDGQNGVLFQVDSAGELADRLGELVHDESRRKQYAAAATVKMATQFTPEKAASSLEAIYDSALRAAGRRR